MNPTRQAFQCSLEHKRMRFVGSHGFGDEDELDGQGEVPSGEVFAIGIGNNRGAYMPERVQDLRGYRAESSLFAAVQRASTRVE